MHLRVIIYNNIPWINKVSDDECDQILCEVFKYISKSLNFTYNFIDYVDDPDKKANRLIGQIENNVNFSQIIYLLN